MQSYDPNMMRSNASHKPTQSSIRSRDPADSTTLPSQHLSAAPTSFLLPPSAVSVSSAAPSLHDQPLISNSNTLPALARLEKRYSRAFPSSATWTTSSGDLALFSDTDQVEDRLQFVLEYNRLAKKHGVRVMVADDFEKNKRNSTPATMTEKRSWWSRFLRTTSHGPQQAEKENQRDPPAQTQPRPVRHRRSVSDLALHLIQQRKEPPKVLSLQAMIRLSGKSLFYLPPEYAPSSLILPTCFRATAQHLAQHGVVARGIFRIPGSLRIINAVYDYYCHENEDEEVTRTIRCPNLPTHLNANIHDVASAFKRFLGVLPGGILGSLSLFDAFVAIHSQLRGEPEFNRTRQTKLRARLIALAIGTLKSQFRRELICAVFGLLALIGRQAEITPHEDEQGRPLPTSDLMGYNALGIVFGPLLVGDLLAQYTMKVAHPSSGLLLFPLTPPKLKRDRSRKGSKGDGLPPSIDKIKVANEITEMVITHWREVVRHLKSLSVMSCNSRRSEDTLGQSNPTGSPEPFAIKQPAEWKTHPSPGGIPGASTPNTPTPTRRPGRLRGTSASSSATDIISVKRVRPKVPRPESAHRISTRQSLNPLSPTAEESIASSTPSDQVKDPRDGPLCTDLDLPELGSGLRGVLPPVNTPTEKASPVVTTTHRPGHNSSKQEMSPRHVVGARSTIQSQENHSSYESTDKSFATGKYSPTRQKFQSRVLCQSTGSEAGDESEGVFPVKKSPLQSDTTRRQKKSSLPPLGSGFVSSRLKKFMGTDQSEESSDIARASPKKYPKQQLYLHDHDPMEYNSSSTAKPSADIEHQWPRDRHDTNHGDHARAVFENVRTPAKDLLASQNQGPELRSETNLTRSNPVLDQTLSDDKIKLIPRTPDKQQIWADENSLDSRDSIQRTPKELVRGFSSPMQEPGHLMLSETDSQDPKLERASPKSVLHSSVPQKRDTAHGAQDAESTSRVPSAQENAVPTISSLKSSFSSELPVTKRSDSITSKAAEVARRSRAATVRPVSTPFRPGPSSSATASTTNASSRRSASKMGGVRAMAAMWEDASKDSPAVPSATPSIKKPVDFQGGGIMSPYAANRTPLKSVRSMKMACDGNSNKGSVAATIRGSPRKRNATSRPLRTSASDSATLRHAGPIASESFTAAGRPAEPLPEVYLRPAVPGAGSKERGHLQRGSEFRVEDERDLAHSRSLGTMVPHQEEPPVDRRINFSRPSTALSHNQTSDGADNHLSVPSPSPNSRGNCLLHAQIRRLQKQVHAQSEEAASLRRQLETQENIDIGTLSEQLREAKRECAMWKARAEAAEKRVAVFEKFTARVRGLQRKAAGTRGAEDPEPGLPQPSGPTGEMTQAPGHQREDSDASAGTEEPEVVAARIRQSLRGGIDGAESSTSHDGGAAAWWKKSPAELPDYLASSDRLVSDATEFGAVSSNAAMEIWRAAQELLASEGLTATDGDKGGQGQRLKSADSWA